MKTIKQTIVIIGANSLSGEEIRKICRQWGVATATANGDNELFIDNSSIRYYSREFWKHSEAVIYECPVSCAEALPVIMNFHYQPRESDWILASSLGQFLAWRGLNPTREQKFLIASEFCPTKVYDDEVADIAPEKFRQFRIDQFLDSEQEGEAKGHSLATVNYLIREAKIVLEQSPLVSFGPKRSMAHFVTTPFISPFCLEEAALLRKNFPPYIYIPVLHDAECKQTGKREAILGGRTTPETISDFMYFVQKVAENSKTDIVEKSVDLIQNKARVVFAGPLADYLFQETNSLAKAIS